jgi:T-complex protein 1 subunit eta
VVLLTGEILKYAKVFIEEGTHPRQLIKALRRSCEICLEHINKIAIPVKKGDQAEAELRNLLEKCAATALSSKLIHQQKEFFAKIAVDAVMHLDELLPLDMIGIKKVQGGALEDSFLVAGVAFKKTFSYAGFEMQPKNYTNPKIAMLNIELELKAERDNAEVRIEEIDVS